MERRTETTQEELDLMRAAIERNDKDIGMTIAAIVILFAAIVAGLVIVITRGLP